ncbi:YifB family Mg chelatase-like AAA ATPase [Halobacillus seohaensis]|uniref:YifB family Mg chelatase-like AAA ATPase n=1 Tax=Halobacillus seohaensis TaxID=447421 RepID=A0ABW2ELE6_9BACI
MATIVKSIGLKGLEGYEVRVEVQSLEGVEQISVIGLPDTSMKESKDRIRGALNSVYADISGRHLIVLFSPTEQKKSGPMSDLAMAIAVLKETAQLATDIPQKTAFIGTLSLDGSIHETEGMLAAVMQAKQLGYKHIYVPSEMKGIEALHDKGALIPVQHLQEVIDHLNGQAILSFPPSTPMVKENVSSSPGYTNFSEIIGHEFPKRALMVAAAGGHHVLLSGPPGCGKSLLASAFPSIIPNMTEETMVDSFSLYQLAHESKALTSHAPYRHPHHSASSVSLVGGGTVPKPGEVSLAHGGVLFLDEMSEFPKKTLDMLRQPLEAGKVTISRVSGTVTYPARFIMIGATNPCPCGHNGSRTNYCICTPKQVHSYKQRLSGPILDRMDIHLQLNPITLTISTTQKPMSSDKMKEIVTQAREKQYKRYNQPITNATTSLDVLETTSPLNASLQELLQTQSQIHHWSNRVQVNILRTARTVADLDQEEDITEKALLEAMSYRSLNTSTSSELIR